MAITYQTGTISIANGSATVTGTGTEWVANARLGDQLLVDDITKVVQAVVSDTELTLTTTYEGAAITDAAYELVPTGATRKGLADTVNAILAQFSTYADNELSGLFGDGSLAEPGIGFASDPDTGFYRRVANTITATKALEAPAFGGDGVTQSEIDTVANRLMKVADFGVGQTGIPFQVNDYDEIGTLPSGFYRNSTSLSTFGSVFGSAGVVIVGSFNPTDARGFLIGQDTIDVIRTGSGVMAAERLYGEGNTTVGAGGELLEASPIVRLFTDRIEEPNTPVGATMERLGAGHYVLRDVPPLATQGWTLKGARDQNGALICGIDQAVFCDGALHVFTSDGAGAPADVPDDAFVMLRFWEGETEGETAPPVDEISIGGLQDILSARRATAIKAACGARIIAAVGETAQANIAQAGVLYAAMRADGVEADAARAAVGFAEGDLETAAAWKQWVNAMQTECRRAIADGDDPAWPVLPDGVADLARRF